MSRNYRGPSDFSKLSVASKRRRLRELGNESSSDESSSETSSSHSSSPQSPGTGGAFGGLDVVGNCSLSPDVPQNLGTIPIEELDISAASASCSNLPGVHASDSETSHSEVSDSESDFGEFSDEDGDILEEPDEVTILEASLREWALKFNITHTAFSDLLHRLRDSHSDCFNRLHTDSRTVLRTPAGKVDLTPVDPGQCLYLGIRKHLEILLSQMTIFVTTLYLLFSVDGFNIHESSFSEIWPITMSLPSFPEWCNTVFPISIYGGPGKPATPDEYLKPFVKELKELLQNGFIFENRLIKISIKILGFSCDTPARDFIMGTKGHGGFSCCTRCKVKGITLQGKRVYLETDCSRRTDEEFRGREDTEFRPAGRSTPLEEIPEIDFARAFIIDPMHLFFQCCLKTLILAWFDTSGHHKFSVNFRRSFVRDVKEFKSYIPSSFTRKLQQIKMNPKKGEKLSLKWKAKEYRLFLLYVGPVLLRKYLSDDKYDHFLRFHVATTILFCPKFCADLDLRGYARKLLVNFVERTMHVYGAEFIVFSFHSLIHVVDDVDFFSEFIPNFSLDRISTFPFENFLRLLKKLVRGKAKSLQQLAKRLEEWSRCKALSHIFRPALKQANDFTQEHEDGPLPSSCRGPQFRKAIFPNFTISATNVADSYCSVSNVGDSNVIIVKTENFAFCDTLGEAVLIGRQFTDLSPFYGTSDGQYALIDSTRLGIFKGKKLSALRCWKVSSITAQYLALPDGKNNSILFPLLHCLL